LGASTVGPDGGAAAGFGRTPVAYRIGNVKTETWHQIMRDLRARGFREVYQYGGVDAGIDYNRYELANEAGDELVVFEWDNWSEGEIRGTPSRLESLREEYRLREPVEFEG
jgi:hypothetical protein